MDLIDRRMIEDKETKRSFRDISFLVPDFIRLHEHSAKR